MALIAFFPTPGSGAIGSLVGDNASYYSVSHIPPDVQLPARSQCPDPEHWQPFGPPELPLQC